MNFYKNINEKEIVDALSFFPGLNAVSEIHDKLTPDIHAKIKKASANNPSSKKSSFLSKLITKYFNLAAYDPLDSLESKDWGIQFFIRDKILAELGKSNTPSEGLQRRIYELIKDPILSYKDYPATFHPYSSTVNDLTVIEAYRVSGKYLNDGSFKIIEASPGNEDSLTHDQRDFQNIFDLCVTSVGNELATIDEPIITTTINLNATDAQLKKDFAEYLTAKRKELSISRSKQKKFKLGKYAPLINHKIIQYLDLKILDIYVNGIDTLKHRQVGEYLFPISDLQNDKDITEATRKSTIKYANDMLDERVIKSLLISAGKLPFSPTD